MNFRVSNGAAFQAGIKNEKDAKRAELACPKDSKITRERLAQWKSRFDRSASDWDDKIHTQIAAEIAPHLIAEIERLRAIVRKGC